MLVAINVPSLRDLAGSFQSGAVMKALPSYFPKSSFKPHRGRLSRRTTYGAALALLVTLCAQAAHAGEPWSAKLDSSVRFYQTTDVGVLVVGTEKSLYGLEAETGDVLWR